MAWIRSARCGCGENLARARAVVQAPTRRRSMAKGQVKQSKNNKQKLTTAEKQKKKKEKQAKK
jgi:hypothetical protein